MYPVILLIKLYVCLDPSDHTESFAEERVGLLKVQDEEDASEVRSGDEPLRGLDLRLVR